MIDKKKLLEKYFYSKKTIIDMTLKDLEEKIPYKYFKEIRKKLYDLSFGFLWEEYSTRENFNILRFLLKKQEIIKKEKISEKRMKELKEIAKTEDLFLIK